MVGMTMSAFAIIVIVQVVQRIVDAVQCGKSIQQFGAPVTRKFLSAFGKGYPHGIFIFGTIILFAGFLLSYGCPINKKIWSSTFVLVTCGFASLFLALLIWIIDINGKKKWTLFFESFGINPLYLYVQGDILAVLLGMSGISAFMYMDLFRPIFGDFGGSLAWAIFFVVLNWIPGYFLYKKKIYIKL